jgi:hypothetical protein
MIILTFLESKKMTITINNSATQATTKVEKSAINIAIELAKKTQEIVVIYKAEIVKGQPKKVLSETKVKFDASPMRSKLEHVATIDQNGNFIDN